MNGKRALIIGIAALAIAAPSAQANARNSLQPAHVFYGQVVSGQHPVRMLTLKNRSGHTWKLSAFKVAGAGGGIFTVVNRDGCRAGLSLKSGESCQFGVRVKATRLGWFRSVLRVCYTENGVKSSGFFGSAELRAHVVAG